MIKISNLITYNDAPEVWSLFFQDNATTELESLEELHNNIMFYLVIILFAVSWIILSIILNYNNAKLSNYINRGTLIELIWTITPALILVLIAFPYFKLLYLMDEVIDPSLVIYGEGHQWYWSYQYPDLTNEDEEFVKFNELLGNTTDKDVYEYSDKLKWDIFYMDNNGSNNGRGGFTNRIAELLNPAPASIAPSGPAFNPIWYKYTHVSVYLSRATALALDADGRASNFFYITDLNLVNRSCNVIFLKPVPSLYNRGEIDLLVRLYELFPYGNDYSTDTAASTLDRYRLQGCIRVELDRVNANPNSIYVANQNKPPGSPYFNPGAGENHYKPWARDIEDAISRYRKDNNTRYHNAILDTDSTIFLTTFKNAHPYLSPRSNHAGPIITALRSL